VSGLDPGNHAPLGASQYPVMPLARRALVILVVAAPLAPDTLAASWALRPDAPKRMDWLYELHDTQSSHIESREHLLKVLGGLSIDEPLRAPPNARGLLLNPLQIERLDLTQDNGVHDRQRFDFVDGVWQQRTLIP